MRRLFVQYRGVVRRIIETRFCLHPSAPFLSGTSAVRYLACRSVKQAGRPAFVVRGSGRASLGHAHLDTSPCGRASCPGQEDLPTTTFTSPPTWKLGPDTPRMCTGITAQSLKCRARDQVFEAPLIGTQISLLPGSPTLPLSLVSRQPICFGMLKRKWNGVQIGLPVNAHQYSWEFRIYAGVS